MTTQDIILGVFTAGLLSLLGFLIQGIRTDMRTMRTEMTEGFRRLTDAIAANGERIAALEGRMTGLEGRMATLEGIFFVTEPRPNDPPQPPLSIEADSTSP